MTVEKLRREALEILSLEVESTPQEPRTSETIAVRRTKRAEAGQRKKRSLQ